MARVVGRLSGDWVTPAVIPGAIHAAIRLGQVPVLYRRSNAEIPGGLPQQAEDRLGRQHGDADSHQHPQHRNLKRLGGQYLEQIRAGPN